MSRPQRLSERQEQVIDFICEEIACGRPPTRAEISREFQISRQAAAVHVREIERKGWLLRRGKSGLEPTDAAWNRQVQRSRERRARAELPRGVFTSGTARAAMMVQSALRGLESASQQLVLDLAVR